MTLRRSAIILITLAAVLGPGLQSCNISESAPPDGEFTKPVELMGEWRLSTNGGVRYLITPDSLTRIDTYARRSAPWKLASKEKTTYVLSWGAQRVPLRCVVNKDGALYIANRKYVRVTPASRGLRSSL